MLAHRCLGETNISRHLQHILRCIIKIITLEDIRDFLRKKETGQKSDRS